MTSWARPGVKCVCVKTLEAWGPFAHMAPRIGKIYTVSGTEWGDISMKEIGSGIYWDASQFRPLHTQSDDVALFKHHLVPQEVEA